LIWPTGAVDRGDFSVVSPVALVKPFANHLALFCDHSANKRIWTGLPATTCGELDCSN